MRSPIVVMGDVVGSGKLEGRALARDLESLVAAANDACAHHVLSPLTVTLGDEFQCVVDSVLGALELLLFLEKETLRRRLPFRMRYVVHDGEIETPVNPDRAHGMLGPGLTRARQLITDKRRSRPRFAFDMKDEYVASQLGRLFSLVETLTGEWKLRDYGLIADMIDCQKDAEVASRHGKDRTMIWKRRRTLRIGDFGNLAAVATDLVRERARS